MLVLAAGRGLFNGPQPFTLRVNAAAMVPVYDCLSHPKMAVAQGEK